MKQKPLIIVSVVFAGACARSPVVVPVPPPRPEQQIQAIIPIPASIILRPGERFVIDGETFVAVDRGVSAEVQAVGLYLVQMLRPSASPKLVTWSGEPSGRIRKHIVLIVDTARADLGEEGYAIGINSDSVTIRARTAAGLFHGVQTIRQLLPAAVENPDAVGRSLFLPAGTVTDRPRFEWRGMSLDVSRHFLPPADVKRFMDAMALYKLNRLHLHLSDDQGWRIEIKSRPNLTTIGGSTKVGGGSGGFYTQAEYTELVEYAQSRYITIVPEIDMPAHTNAALASYPELNCDKIAPPLYTGIKVGFSALCVDSATVLPFVEDVVRELSALTPGGYFHIGGDEVMKLTHAQYVRFIESVEKIVTANGKRMIGWSEISPAALSPNTIVQNWKRDSSFLHAARGGKVIMSPSKKLYLDMKYDSTTVLGLNWAGFIEVKDAYDWDPGTFIPGVTESSILGVEGPLWSETLAKSEDYEQMAFPRLIAIAEVGWSSTSQRSWNSFSERLAAHGRRLSALGLNFYRSPQIRWLP